jgi:hypothetical protein
VPKSVIIRAAHNTSADFEEITTRIAYAELRRLVGGDIQVVRFTYLGEPAQLICNEDGKLIGLPINEMATKIMSGVLDPADYIVGDVAILIGDKRLK